MSFAGNRILLFSTCLKMQRKLQVFASNLFLTFSPSSFSEPAQALLTRSIDCMCAAPSLWGSFQGTKHLVLKTHPGDLSSPYNRDTSKLYQEDCSCPALCPELLAALLQSVTPSSARPLPCSASEVLDLIRRLHFRGKACSVHLRQLYFVLSSMFSNTYN